MKPLINLYNEKNAKIYFSDSTFLLNLIHVNFTPTLSSHVLQLVEVVQANHYQS